MFESTLILTDFFSVKEAQAEDIPWMMDEGKRFFESVAMNEGLEYDRERTGQYLVRCLYNENYVIFIGWKNEERAAMMLCRLEELFCAEGKNAKEMFLYVCPKYRGSPLARLLILRYVGWAQSKQAQRVFISSNAGHKPESARKLYERLGFGFDGITCSRRL